MIDNRGSFETDAPKTRENKRTARGRKPEYESRSTEFRQRLIAWKQSPVSLRPSLRAVARELGTSHQMLAYYLNGLDRWQAKEEAKRIRAQAEAEGREMTLPECLDAIVTPGLFRQIEKLKQAAKRGPLNYWQIKMLKLYARRFPQAQELLQKHSHRALERKRFAEIVKETPRLEGETAVAWVRRIWDQCAKYGTECPEQITEGLLQKLSRPG